MGNRSSIVLTGFLRGPALVLVFVLFLPAAALSAAAPEQLIVFLQPDASEMDRTFQEKYLPQIRELAQSMNVEVSVADARKNAPEEVALTPLLVYQNHRGRSVYQGRTTTLDRVRNFIRTSRFVPQGDAAYERTDIPVWEYGRTKLWAPIKVAAVTGTPPEGYDHEAFVREARQAMERGFDDFRTREKVSLGRADRGFYMDFYPWRADDGTLYLSLALYSMFDCHTPVFEMKKPPLIGPWEDREKMFEKAGELMEAAVKKQIADTESGDGFHPVAGDVSTADWTAMGFPLPQKPENESVVPVDAELPQEWTLSEPGPNDPPMVLFRFPAPIDQYKGEATRGKGSLKFPDSLEVSGSEGYVEIDPTSVTMGVPDLDQALQSSVFLKTKTYPVSKFVVSAAQGENRPLSYGRLSAASVSGTFTLKGREVPMTLPVEMEPVLGEDGKPKLLARGSFRINVDEFDIEGADGPSPANKTVIIDVNLVFQPEA